MKWKKMIIKELEKCVKDNNLGLSQKEIADRLGLSKNTLIYSIRNEVLKLSVFQDLCEILEISPCKFFSIDYDMSEEDKLIASDSSMTYDMVSREMYTEMKEQLQSEINHLRELNSELIGCKKQTGT